MKVLVDSCIWSLSLRRRRTALLTSDQQRIVSTLDEAIQHRRVAIIGAIRQELLSGIRDKTQFLKTQQSLTSFLDEDVMSADYVEAARLYNVCQDHGVQCGSTDMLICAVAARHRFAVLTNDQALIRCLALLGIPHP